MKTLINTIIGLSILAMLTACGGGNSTEAKKAELEKLRSEQTAINDKITALEEEIAKSGDTLNTAENDRAKVIAVTAVAPLSFSHSIDVQGRVDGDEVVTYQSRVPSTVQRVNVKVGQRVSSGQILAELDGKAVKAQLDALQKNYELVNTLYEKQKALWDEKVGSEIQFLQAKNNKESMERQLAGAKENLDMYYIRADFNGTVDQVNIKIGQSVAPGVPAIRVVNPSKLKVKADLSESYISNVKTGDIVDLTFPDINNKNVKTKVSYASKAIDPMTRTFQVEVELPSTDEYRPNMIAEIHIIDYKNEKAIAIPVNTVQQLDDKSVVYLAVKEGNKTVARKREVKVGKMYNGTVEVLSGLTAGEQLITTGYQDLTDGETIKY